MRGKRQRRTALDDSIEPVTRTRWEGDRFSIVAELPEMAEEKIRIDLERTILVISAATPERRYRKEIPLPWRARFPRKKFHDGILELSLEKDTK